MFQSLNQFLNKNVVLHVYIHALLQKGLESLSWVDSVLDQAIKEIMKLTTVGIFRVKRK